jgi:hypothetical protein
MTFVAFPGHADWSRPLTRWRSFERTRERANGELGR